VELIAITAPGEVRDEHRKVRALFDAGCRRLHLRKPGWSLPRLRGWLRGIPAALHPRLVVHHETRLGRDFALAGFHRRRRAWVPGTVSLACHRPAELRALPRGLDYVCYAPVFASISKPRHGPDRGSGPALRAALARHCGPPVLALGGITPERLGEIRDRGFAGAAVLGWLWDDDPDRREIARRWRALTLSG